MRKAMEDRGAGYKTSKHLTMNKWKNRNDRKETKKDKCRIVSKIKKNMHHITQRVKMLKTHIHNEYMRKDGWEDWLCSWTENQGIELKIHHQVFNTNGVLSLPQLRKWI